MKKAVTLILVLSFVFATAVCARSVEYGLKPVPSSVQIDGVLSEGEWDGAVRIELTKENTGMWANFYDENSRLPLYAYFYYGEDGIYVGADIYDNDVDKKNMHDCFEVAFNPGGLIPDGDSLEGLFFTFWLEGKNIRMKRHNRFDGDQVGEFEDGAVCKYKTNGHGYTVEALIKWEWLTLPDRPVLDVRSGEYRTGVLDKFDHKADNAFVYAIVCYLNGNGGDKNTYRCVYRTVTDPSLAGNFSTATYDIKFTFEKEEETTAAETTEEETTAAETTEKAAVTEAETTAEEAAGQSGGRAWMFVLPTVAAVIASLSALFIVISKKRNNK